MRAQTVGRVLGIGVRVAGRIAGERLSSTAQSSASSSPQAARNTSVQVGRLAGNAGRRAAQTSAGVTRGIGGFLSPFRHVGRILWLEITGAFFLLPVVAFSPNLWRMRASWAHGPDHRMFLVTAGVVLVFLYLGLSSFWRAHRR